MAGFPLAEDVDQVGAGLEGRDGGEIGCTGIPEMTSQNVILTSPKHHYWIYVFLHFVWEKNG